MSKKPKLPDISISSWNARLPYNHLPPLPPHGELESYAVLKQCIQARVGLAGLKQAAELIPNPAMLINTLPILEARSSSAIENIVTTNDKLFRYLDEESLADPVTREALRYRTALLEGFEALQSRPISLATALAICTHIKGIQMQVRRVPGVAIVNESNMAVIYTPPDGLDTLNALLANWERFMNTERRLDPLVRLAIGHYQFEAIHPFSDGNGRTGRVLNSLFLIQENLLTLPILYLSRYIIANKGEYYRLLLRITSHGEWQPWILYMLKAIEETANWTTAKIAAIRLLVEETALKVRATYPKIYRRELIDAIFEQPYCRISTLVERGIAHRETASHYLKTLASIGILDERKLGRDKVFVNPKLLGLLSRGEAAESDE